MMILRAVLGAMLVLWPIAAAADRLSTSAGPVEVQAVATGLEEPWSLGFLPDGGILVTERGGRLLLVQDGRGRAVAGVPSVWARGQGGLFDVLVPRDFATTRDLFLSYAKPHRGDAVTAVAQARLSADGTRLENLREIFAMAPGGDTTRHFGGRLVEAPDGRLFLTIGERGNRPAAQDLGRHEGSVIRINRDGTVPRDNPFVGRTGARPEVWSYGHRNPQGAAMDAAGQLWVVEHGAQGGDEVNWVEKGANYGWPVISYGRHYSGAKIGEGTAKPGMKQPAFYWDPSIAPSGMAIYSGKLWPEWRGDVFVGSLKLDYISRLDGAPLRERERIEGPMTGRVRDVREAPDGSLWFLSVYQGAAYRMTPAR